MWADKSYWDIIVIDEAHNVAFRGSTLSQRARLADLLSRHSDTLIMASATPHDGKPASFASLMNMLNPTAIADPQNYGPEDIKGLFLRRYKKHVQEQVSGSFLERKVSKHAVPASPEEEAAYRLLDEARFLSFDRSRRAGQLLFKTVLEKALFSSPAACLETVRQRLRKLEKESGDEVSRDRITLHGLAEALQQIGPANFTKYRRLVDALKPDGVLHWNPRAHDDRVVIFTERIETLRFLEQNLARDLNLPPEQIAVVHGTGIDDVDLQKTVEDFGRDRSPVRLLLASDIASEGLNLHFLCHKLIHFDIPWSLMVFQQRNGRIDRYGQERQPHISYFYTEPRHPKVRGDLRILELLMEKDEQAAKNIGDPSVFLGVFDAQEEEKMTGKAIEDNLAPEEFDQQMEKASEADLLAILLGDAPVPAGQTVRNRCHTRASLFPDELAYFREGLTALNHSIDLQATFDDDRCLATITVNDDLRRAFRALPREAIPEDDRLHLTTDRDLVKRGIKDSRGDESRWPHIHLLWDLHPVMEWLNFKLMVNFGRRQAPAIRLSGALAPGESMFLIQGEIPNRKGQPVIHEWFAVQFNRQRLSGILTLPDFLEKTKLNTRTYPNPGQYDVPVATVSLLSEAVAEARRHMSRRRQEFEKEMQHRLTEEMGTLAALQQRQLSFVESKYPTDRSKDQHRRRIDEMFAGYRRWVEDTMKTEDSPFLRIAGVFLG